MIRWHRLTAELYTQVSPAQRGAAHPNDATAGLQIPLGHNSLAVAECRPGGILPGCASVRQGGSARCGLSFYRDRRDCREERPPHRDEECSAMKGERVFGKAAVQGRQEGSKGCSSTTARAGDDVIFLKASYYAKHCRGIFSIMQDRSHFPESCKGS